MKFKPNERAIATLEAQIKDAYAETMTGLNEEFDAVIEDPGEFANIGFENQDIVDTGRFRDSKLINPRDRSWQFTWDPVDPVTGYHYAAALMNGFDAYGKYPILGRDWVQRGIERFDPIKQMSNKLGRRAKVKRRSYEPR